MKASANWKVVLQQTISRGKCKFVEKYTIFGLVARPEDTKRRAIHPPFFVFIFCPKGTVIFRKITKPEQGVFLTI